MDILRLVTAALFIEFWVIYIFKVLGSGKSIKKWYNDFGALAVISDVTSVLIGIMIAFFISPGASVIKLAMYSVIVQVIHDVLYYVPVPAYIGSYRTEIANVIYHNSNNNIGYL
jgi:uncharacterized protein YacL